jgi:hypothetical protein
VLFTTALTVRDPQNAAAQAFPARIPFKRASAAVRTMHCILREVPGSS